MNDYISRQAVLKILKDMWNTQEDANDAMQESINLIEDLPSVTPAERTGKLCDTCIYRDKSEYEKPCVLYRDDCELYKEM